MRTLVLLTLSVCAFGQHTSGPARVARAGGGGGGYRARTVYVPYGVPFDPFYAGYANGYGYDPSYGYQQGYDPNSGYAPQQTPNVIVNQNYLPETAHPMLHDYTNTLPPSDSVQAAPLPPAAQAPGPPGLRDDQPTIFLIAMKDHTIYPVIAYWVDKDALKYVTVDTVVKSVPMAQVDRDLSIQLNDQRNVEFKLPAPGSTR